MFLGQTKVDEIFISGVSVKSILGNHFLEQEKQKMRLWHTDTIRNVELSPFFNLNPPPVINNFPV